MLAFYTNFLAKTVDTVVDHQTNKCFLLIQKCGTQSLLNLTRTDPARFSKQTFSTQDFPFDTVQVFVRDPIGRFMTGLRTQIELYGLNQKSVDYMINNNQIIHFFDTHTSPQFWFLLKFGIGSEVKFAVKELSQLNEVSTGIRKLNQAERSFEFNLSTAAFNRIDHFLTEDVVLYNNFLNKTVLLDDIIRKIKYEKDFVRDISQYDKEINYLTTKEIYT